MKKAVLFSFLLMGLVVILGSFGGGGKYPSGAPSGYTGSPFDGKDCADPSCHSTTSTSVTGWITSNVPAQGYTPGASYTITVSVTGNSGDNKGFEVSPQALDGTLLGTLTPGAGTKFASSDPKYVTHSSAKTGTTAVWTLTWVAPVNQTGSVTFYGAFVSSFPDVFHSTLVIPENNVGIVQHQDPVHFLVYPNPAKERIHVSYTLNQSGHVLISLYDLTGNIINTVLDEMQPAGEMTHSFDLKGEVRPGVYFIKVSNDYGSVLQKVIVN